MDAHTVTGAHRDGGCCDTVRPQPLELLLRRGLNGERLHGDLAAFDHVGVGPQFIDIVRRIGRPDDVADIVGRRQDLEVETGAGLGKLGKQPGEQSLDCLQAAQLTALRHDYRSLGVVSQRFFHVARTK